MGLALMIYLLPKQIDAINVPSELEISPRCPLIVVEPSLVFCLLGLVQDITDLPSRRGTL